MVAVQLKHVQLLPDRGHISVRPYTLQISAGDLIYLIFVTGNQKLTVMKTKFTFCLLSVAMLIASPVYAGTGPRHDTNLISLSVLALLLASIGINALAHFIKVRRRANHTPNDTR